MNLIIWCNYLASYFLHYRPELLFDIALISLQIIDALFTKLTYQLFLIYTYLHSYFV